MPYEDSDKSQDVIIQNSKVCWCWAVYNVGWLDKTGMNHRVNHLVSSVVKAEAEQLVLANIMDECFITMSSSKPDKLLGRGK